LFTLCFNSYWKKKFERMKNSNLKKSFIGKGIYPRKWAFLLLIPFRNIFLSPKKLIQRLELQKNSIVLEIGPGPGYFSVPIAKHISEGKLYLADIQQEMLDLAKRRLFKKKITNVDYHLWPSGNVEAFCGNLKFPFLNCTYNYLIF